MISCIKYIRHETVYYYIIIKALAKLQAPLPAPGGELSLIPIEQLIKIEDITTPIKPPISSSMTGVGNTSSTSSSALLNIMNPKAVGTNSTPFYATTTGNKEP